MITANQEHQMTNFRDIQVEIEKEGVSLAEARERLAILKMSCPRRKCKDPIKEQRRRQQVEEKLAYMQYIAMMEGLEGVPKKENFTQILGVQVNTALI